MMTVIRLRMLELHLIPNFKLVLAAGVDLQDISGRLTGSVDGMTGTRQEAIHNGIFGVVPDNGQVDGNKHHVDGFIKAALTCCDK